MHTDSTVELITARIAAVGARANTSDSMSIAANVLAYSMIRIEEGRVRGRCIRCYLNPAVVDLSAAATACT